MKNRDVLEKEIKNKLEYFIFWINTFFFYNFFKILAVDMETFKLQFFQLFLHRIIKFLCSLESSFHEDFENGLTFSNSCTLRGILAVYLKGRFFWTPCIYIIFVLFCRLIFWTSRAGTGSRVTTWSAWRSSSSASSPSPVSPPASAPWWPTCSPCGASKLWVHYTQSVGINSFAWQDF